MELYDKKYVYFEWDDKLKGKKGFFANTINELKSKVESGFELLECHFSNNPTGFHFSNSISNNAYQFFYYDPYYEFRKAYLEGKQLQFKNCKGDWGDVVGTPIFTTDEYRIKPTNIYYAMWNENNIYVDINVGNNSKILFYSENKDEVEHFIETHLYLHDIIKSAFEGKTIEYKEYGVENDYWKEIVFFDNDLSMHDFVHYEYRIKPSEDKYVPFDTVQELIDCWDNKYPQNKSRPKGTMPLIWIKEKESDIRIVITEYYFERDCHEADVGTSRDYITLERLFYDYTFLDGSVIGKVEK